MSRYFQTLKRLHSGETETPAAAQPTADFATQALKPGLYTFPNLMLQSAKVQTALSDLLESLRIAARNTPSRCLVVAGVSDDQASGHLMAGLETVAEHRPLKLVTGELAITGGDRFIRLRRTACGETREDDSTAAAAKMAEALDLSDNLLPENLRGQIELVTPKADLAVVHGPPLCRSAEAALLASATGGLVVVLEPLITRRSDLFLALDHAEMSGSAVLGVVTMGAQDALPPWPRRLLPG